MNHFDLGTKKQPFPPVLSVLCNFVLWFPAQCEFISRQKVNAAPQVKNWLRELILANSWPCQRIFESPR